VSSSLSSERTRVALMGSVVAAGNRWRPRPCDEVTPCRRQANASTWSRTPLIMYSACHALPRAILDRACRAYSHPIEATSIAAGSWACSCLIASPEQQAEGRCVGAELLRGRERDIHLQRVLQQEHPIDRPAPAHVHVVHTAMLPIHASGPVGDHLTLIGPLDQPEGQVDVRPLVLSPSSSRAGQSRATDPAVRLGRRNKFVP
jgi:hypothetical protein